MAVGENDGYDTILHKISRYDTIRYTVPKRSAVCNGQQSEINAAFSLTPSHAFACVQTPSTVDGIRTLSITFDSVRTWGMVRYQKLIDFSSIQTHAVNRGRPRSTAVLHCRTPSTTFDSRERGDVLIALLDFSSVLTDVWTSLTTFERLWEVHLRLHSSRPSQRICGRRPGTACIWVWPHTGWTTTLVPNRLRGNYSDIWYDAIRIQYRDIRYDTMYRAITKLFWGIMLHFLDIFIH